ncbi:hypothetical protein ACQR1Y_16075 [Bradyrhizobium sp. HKCCYLRH3099]|uniref:hypothetical protein n=1 Tax=unclassified Bradyrhizobium TaxID=2631580 RepID=UPI003EBEC507
MIDLHERLSEFSFGYGVTREVESLLATVGLHPTPFMPSLLHEKELGFDVQFKDQGRIVVLQFKLGEELKRFHRTKPNQSIPLLDHPFWRYQIDTTAHQFRLLAELEDEDVDVYYVAPRFSTWQAYEKAFQDGAVLENSLLLKPSEISRGLASIEAPDGVHRVVYDRFRRYVCSDPIEIHEELPRDLVEKIAHKIRSGELSLSAQIEHIFRRPERVSGPGLIDPVRSRQLFQRARSPIEAMAAIVGVQAWSQGAQLLFVTD